MRTHGDPGKGRLCMCGSQSGGGGGGKRRDVLDRELLTLSNT